MENLDNDSVMKALQVIRPGQKVIFGRHLGGYAPNVAPQIYKLVTELEKDMKIVRFNKRIKGTKDFLYVAVGVTPRICQNIEKKLRRLDLAIAQAQLLKKAALSSD